MPRRPRLQLAEVPLHIVQRGITALQHYEHTAIFNERPTLKQGVGSTINLVIRTKDVEIVPIDGLESLKKGKERGQARFN